MDIIIHFTQWDPHQNHKIEQPIVSWQKRFNTDNYDPARFELALGYIYGLILLKPHSANLNITFNHTNYKYRQFLQLPVVRQYFSDVNRRRPRLFENLTAYIHRARAHTQTKQYLLVISPTHTEEGRVDLIQFNNITFLQGFLSIFRAFRIGPILYIVDIYDQNGIEYTFRYD